jgi:ribosome-associated protein
MAARSKRHDAESRGSRDATGEPEDLEPGSPSRSARKRASEELQRLGEALVDLHADVLARLPLPDKLRDAIVESQRLTSFGARRRQAQFIGKLMRRLDDETVQAARDAVQAASTQSAGEAHRLHQVERWREALLADDDALSRWLAEWPHTDSRQLRALIRQARKESRDAPPGEGRPHGPAFRKIFSLLREQLTANAESATADESSS